MTIMTLETVDSLGRTAAHTGMTEDQLQAILTTLRVSAPLARRAEMARRRRLIWIAEGMGCNEEKVA